MDGVYLPNDQGCTCGAVNPEDCTCNTFDVEKAMPDQHLVFGWANVSLTEDGGVPFDWHDDMIAPKILEKAAYNFVMKYRDMGEMHVGETQGQLVESIMFTKEKMQALGIPEGVVPEGWWVGFYVPDVEVCQKIKDGQYKMFSIQGRIKRLKV